MDDQSKQIKEKDGRQPMELFLREAIGQARPDMTDKQIQIILAAISLFGEKGYAATSTKEIAQLAGVAEGTVFKHFNTKKELMLFLCGLLVEHVIEPFIRSGLNEIFEGNYSSLEDFLTAVFRNRLQLLSEAMPVARVLFQELPFHPEVRSLLVEKLPHRQLQTVLETMMERDLIVRMQPQLMMTIFLSSMMGYLLLHGLLPELLGDADAELDAFVKFMVRGLRKE